LASKAVNVWGIQLYLNLHLFISYTPRTNGNLLADSPSHNILNMWKNYFSPLLNAHRASDVRQIEIHNN
jgi:hypothetical protein